jgi:flagellar basal body rod protein FlgB
MSSVSASVIDQISASLSVSSLRNQVIASNIANRDTVGYRRLQVNFKRAMDGAGSAAVTGERASAPVSLEQDLVALSSNSMQYQALAHTLSRYFSIISAITSPNGG